MPRSVSAAEAKARLSALTAEVAYGGQRVIIERRGKPLAALVSVSDLERIEQDGTVLSQPHGVLALAGAWRELGDDDLDSLVAEVYAARKKDMGRPVDLEV